MHHPTQRNLHQIIDLGFEENQGTMLRSHGLFQSLVEARVAQTVAP